MLEGLALYSQLLLVSDSLLICLSIALFVSAVNVYIRDIEYIVAFFVNMLFYATPILYSIDMFKKTWLIWIFRLNPMAQLINAYRDVFYVHRIPELSNLLILLAIGLGLLIICYRIFKKLDKRFAEVLQAKRR